MTPRQSEKGVTGSAFGKESCLTWKLPTLNYMFKVNNKNTRTRCEICSKLKKKDTRTAPKTLGMSQAFQKSYL